MNKRPLLIFSALTIGSLATGIAVAGVSTNSLPLGDGHTSLTGAKKGYVYICQKGRGGAGAQANGPWIHGNTFNLSQKAIVEGKVTWSQARVSIKVKGSRLLITSNDLPKGATTGVFPISAGSEAHKYDGNPNSIKASNVSLSLAAKPKKAKRAGCLSGGPIGIARNGVYIFDALDAQDRDAVAHEVQDSCDGHPQQQGNYHYHSIPACLGTKGVVGYALDGYPITGNVENGRSITNADLDACHGRTSRITLRGKKVRIYHYVATKEYPYTIGCFHGTAVQTRTPG